VDRHPAAPRLGEGLGPDAARPVAFAARPVLECKGDADTEVAVAVVLDGENKYGEREAGDGVVVI
jgi:hypothetical protein